MKNCSICEYWLEIEGSGMGKCRLRPPQAALVPTQGVAGQSLVVVSYWPETKAGEMCSECVPSPLLAAAQRQGITLSSQEGDDKAN